MNIKNTGLIFAMNVMIAKSGVKPLHPFPSECPQWLYSILDDTLSEIDNCDDEVKKLLQAFVDSENYVDLQNNLKGERWFIDSYGHI